MKRENFDWFLGRKGGAREMGKTGIGQWLLAGMFVIGVICLLSVLAHP